MNKRDIVNQQSDFIIYTSNDGDVNVEVFLKDETVWLTQKAISALYGVQRPAITKHLKNIFDSGELQEDSVTSILEHTASDGKKYKTKFYNLDTIISVGYRVNSYQATQFRIWATRTLKDQKITDIYALAADYDINAPVTKDFFATVQNKFHWAITGKTAAEIIYDSADATKIHMGLTGWKQAPDGKILMKMQDMIQFLHSFLNLSNYPILQDKNHIS
ncbi:MAG: RhuM family protein, partial [Euryarchaeota archaeon]|nr:RhuM family protein [Euryarchaeota archaeon]